MIMTITVKMSTVAVVKRRPEKNSGSNGIQTYDFKCNTSAALDPTELTSQVEAGFNFHFPHTCSRGLN